MDTNNDKRARVVVPGTFDILHDGHKRLLDYAFDIGDVTVTINSCEFSKELGKELYESDESRKSAIKDYAELRKQYCEVYVVNSEEESLQRTLDKTPCFRLTGNDWDLQKTSDRCGVEETFWEDHNIYLIYKDRLPNINSTQLRDAITNTNRLRTN